MSSLLLGASWIDFSARYKIRLGGARRALAALPIYGCYDVGFGLIAEEVDKINPALVTRDKEGKPYIVRYDQVNAMLLNEFLKEHRRNDEQQATIARLSKQVEALTAGLQKVSAQLEAGKPAPQVVGTP